MPRDDLSIDFVRKMPPAAELDPALILDEWIHNTQNLPEEIRFMQDEIADKDRQYDKLVKEIDKNDERIQKFIKANGSFQPNPKEEEYRATIIKNFDLAEQLSKEKLELTRKLQHTFDKHLRALDKQIKILHDRGDPGFTDPDELPSLVRDSAANMTSTPTVLRPVNGNHPISTALNGLANGATGPNGGAAGRTNQLRNVPHHTSASAPATPAATIILNQQRARENSAGPGGGGGAARKGAVRSHSGLNLQTSGIGRHSSLGPGTPKSSGGASAGGGGQRAGSAGPRNTGKASGGGSTSRKSVPSGSSAASRKKGSSAPSAGSGTGPGGVSANGVSGSGSGSGHKSTLSRVLKRAGTGGSGTGAKNSPNSTSRANSTGDSDLSDADSNLSGSESGVDHRRVGGGGGGGGGGTGRNTPLGGHSRSVSHHHHTNSSFSHKDDVSQGHHHPGHHHPSSSLASNGHGGAGGGGHFQARTTQLPPSHHAQNMSSSNHNRNRSTGHHHLQEMHRSPSLSGRNNNHHNNPNISDDEMDLDDNMEMDLDDEEAGDDRKYCLCQNKGTKTLQNNKGSSASTSNLSLFAMTACVFVPIAKITANLHPPPSSCFSPYETIVFYDDFDYKKS
ncbi:inhibitor of growth proteins N-terminal histone-binding-domain-containing protein [Copromyces sp. CBS 386.78]|nr:inhibitor of growth proteins N-terminal histone-binding-domain-containing protein [Copromyces sp. CBS 386.78]